MMPSKSRKKIKGQARKAKAKAAAAAKVLPMVQRLISPNNSTNCEASCEHGQEELELVCKEFMVLFYQSYMTNMCFEQVPIALSTAYDMHPEAVNNKYNLEIVEKKIISNGVNFILGQTLTNNMIFDFQISFGSAIALMLIGSYAPSSPVRVGTIDERDAKTVLRNFDSINGCKRSLVKFFAKQTPCNCLDEMYSGIRESDTSKMSMCAGCKQMKERNSMFVCTGCERMQYCSKGCQIAHVPNHKDLCKRIQAGRLRIL